MSARYAYGYVRVSTDKQEELSPDSQEKLLREYAAKNEYSCAATPQIRQTGNRLSGLAETAYASLLAQCFV